MPAYYNTCAARQLHKIQKNRPPTRARPLPSLPIYTLSLAIPIQQPTYMYFRRNPGGVGSAGLAGRLLAWTHVNLQSEVFNFADRKERLSLHTGGLDTLVRSDRLWLVFCNKTTFIIHFIDEPYL